MKTFRWLAIACITAAVLSPALVRAQGTLTTSGASAEVKFPTAINFSVKASSATPVTYARLRYSVEQESFARVISEAIVPFTPAASVNLAWTLDMRRVGGLPPGTVLRYWWVLRDASGNQVETQPATVEFQDNRYKWQTVTDGLINIFWYSGSQSFGNEMLATAKDALSRLGSSTGARITRPIKMYIYASTQDLLGALMFPQEWTGAVTFSQFGIIAAGINQSNLDWGKSAIAHELTHLTVHQVTSNPYNDLPRWLDEGLAMYNQGTLDVSFSTALANAVKSGSLISVRSLASPFSADTNLAALSYAESFSIVDFLISQYGQDKMHQLLLVFHDGSTYDDALKSVYGFDMTGLDALWKARVDQMFKPSSPAGVTA